MNFELPERSGPRKDKTGREYGPRKGQGRGPQGLDMPGALPGVSLKSLKKRNPP